MIFYKIKKTILLSLLFQLLFMVSFVQASKKKVFYVNSYHKGYAWSDDITYEIFKRFGIKTNENGLIDDSDSFVEFKIFYMDTKLHNDESFKKKSALKAKEIIDKWQPDVVITSDDNAIKYLIMPYYKNSDLPVVFCGINIDASIYGLPYNNTTGMVEILLIDIGYELLKPYIKRNKICSLSSDTLSDRKIVGMSKKYSKIIFDAIFVTNYKDLKKYFIEIQNVCGVLFITEPFSVKNFNKEDYKYFVRKNIKIPIFTAHAFVKEFAVLTVGAMGNEQGEWAAETAIRILNGEKPSDIPLTVNKKAQIFLNMELAKQLGIIFPMELLEEAYFVSEGSIQ